jgi:hypothetical protein
MADATLVTEMNALESRRTAAVIARDIRSLRDMLSDGLMYCHSTGVIDSKTEFLAKIAEARSIFHAFSAIADAASEPVPGTRIAAGELHIDVEIAGHVHEVRGRFFAVWCKRDAHWRLEGFQGVGG